jgi:hypothetical protein
MFRLATLINLDLHLFWGSLLGVYGLAFGTKPKRRHISVFEKKSKEFDSGFQDQTHLHSQSLYTEREREENNVSIKERN